MGDRPGGSGRVNLRATGMPGLHRMVALSAAIVVTGAVLVGTAGAQAPERAPSATKPTRGGSVTYGLEAETNGGWCIPQAQLVISGIMVASAIYDTLTVPNSTGKIVPYLAKSVTHDPTYTKWTITLRDGVQFHDGTPLTADAVKQNIDAWRKGRLLGFVFTNIADTTVVDPLTVQVTTKAPWVDFDSFLYLAGRAGIAAPAQLDNAETCPTNLIGTGPFMIYNGAGHWIQNQEFVATRNPHYWQKDQSGTQLPYLDKITFKPNPDAEQRLNQLQAGQLDIMHTTSGQVMTQLDGISSLNQMREKAGRREVRYYLLNAAKPPFDDLNARKAVAYALDTNQINVIRNDSQLQVADQPFDTKVPGHLAKPGYPKHDLAKAKQMVKAYKDAHAGQFNVVIESTNDPENSGEAQLIKRQFAQAGINATLADQLRQVQGPAAADAARPGSLGARPREAHGHLRTGEQDLRDAGLQPLGVLGAVGHRVEPQGARSHGAAASRRWRHRGVRVRQAPSRRSLGQEVALAHSRGRGSRARSAGRDRLHAADRQEADPAPGGRHPGDAVHVQPAAAVARERG
jgi:peptide/nickel transport system substrate-binding protein